MTAKLTIGPLLFHWSPERRQEFYYQIADNPAIDTVYLGEVICSKRTPFFASYIDKIYERLKNSGKTVVFSSLSEVTEKRDQRDVQKICAKTTPIEANDSSALWHLTGRPHYIGQLMNVYNENTLEYLANKGATHFCLPAELPAASIEMMGQKAKELDVNIEVQVFGRVSLALSARCYHARAHDRIKANCKLICEEDLDGMDLQTISKTPFLTINGIQTLSYTYLNLIAEMDNLKKMGVLYFRLSPHTNDMQRTIQIFDDVLKNITSVEDAQNYLKETGITAPFSNGFYYQEPGMLFKENHS